MTNPKADLLQGTLDMLILKALSLGRCMVTASFNAFARCQTKCSPSSRAHFTRAVPYRTERVGQLEVGQQ